MEQPSLAIVLNNIAGGPFYLFEHGGDINELTSDGKTALDLIDRESRFGEFLESKGALGKDDL
jgi:hypothetical protein